MSYVPPPASVTVYFLPNEVCSISHESLSVLHRQNNLVQASCNHFFDRDSINQWTRQNPTCPICRRSITIRQVRILPSTEDSLLDKVGRLIMKILELLWKGIVFFVSILSNSSYTSHRTVYVETRRPPPPFREPMTRTSYREPMYVPPSANRTPVYVSSPPAGTVRNGRVVLGTRAED